MEGILSKNRSTLAARRQSAAHLSNIREPRSQKDMYDFDAPIDHVKDCVDYQESKNIPGIIECHD